MKKSSVNIILFFLLNQTVAYSQEISPISIGGGFTVTPSFNFVSSAAIQIYPYSESIFERNLLEELSGGFGYGISIKKKLFREELSFELSTEYVSITDDELVQTLQLDSFRAKVRVTEQLWMVPLEFSGIFNIPNFDENLKIFLGGGVGIYFGDRVQSISNFKTKTLSTSPEASFLILTGLEYYFSNRLSSVFEMRFRQGAYNVDSEYPVSSITVNGINYPIEKNLNSTIFVDGIRVSLGIGYHF